MMDDSGETAGNSVEQAGKLLRIAREGGNWTPRVAPHFWEKAWLPHVRQMVAADPTHERTLLEEALKYTPPLWGALVDTFHAEDVRLVVLLEDSYTNWKARLNQAHILKALTFTGCVRLVCSSGATGPVDTSSVSSFPDPDVRLKVSFAFLMTLELTAEEFTQIVDRSDFEIWGVEDKELYERQLQLNKEGRTDEMLRLHEAVPAIYVRNALARMDEKQETVAVLTTGAYDMMGVCESLREKRVSYYWIRGTPEGPDAPLEYRKLLTGARLPIDEVTGFVDSLEGPLAEF